MGTDDIDPEEIEILLKALTAKPVAPPKPLFTPGPAKPVTSSVPGPVTTPPPAQRAVTPGWRWSNVRLLMPAPRKEHRNRLAFLSAIKLPGLPAVELPWLRNLQSTIQSSVQSSAMPARVFVALGVMLSAAMPYWPYAHAWSWGLLVYFAVVMLLVVTGIWSAKLTWDARLPAAHTIALGVVIWSFGLIAAEAVPRIAFV